MRREEEGPICPPGLGSEQEDYTVPSQTPGIEKCFNGDRHSKFASLTIIFLLHFLATPISFLENSA